MTCSSVQPCRHQFIHRLKLNLVGLYYYKKTFFGIHSTNFFIAFAAKEMMKYRISLESKIRPIFILAAFSSGLNSKPQEPKDHSPHLYIVTSYFSTYR